MSSSSTLPPVPTPPPAPDISSLYGDKGGLVSAPPTKRIPAAVSPVEFLPLHPDETPSATVRGLSSAGEALTGVVKGGAQFVGGIAKDVANPPGNTIGERLGYLNKKYVLDPAKEQGKKAQTAPTAVESVGHSVAEAIPFIGPMTADIADQVSKKIAEQIGAKDYAGAAGTIVGTGAGFDVLEKAGELAKTSTEPVIKHLQETGRTFGTQVEHEAIGAANAKAPAGSSEAGKIDLSSVGSKPVEKAAPKPVAPGKVDLSSVGGKPLPRPEPEIQAEGPDWDRTHSAILDGRKVGSVGMKIDPQGRAQIYGSVVKPELRGQGIGQKLYRSAIEDARAQGADRITSDSTNTSPDANRVWEKLRDSGEPVEEITHPNGKPGYQIDFTGEEAPSLVTNSVTSKGQEALDALKTKFGTSDDPSGVKKGATFITPEGDFIHLGATEHHIALSNVGYEENPTATTAPRPFKTPAFMDDTGTIRVRYSVDRAGPTAHISVPAQGVTDAQIPAIQQTIAQAGRYGNVVLERSDITPETKDRLSMTKEFPRPGDTEDYLRRIEAHPDQHQGEGLLTSERQSALKEPYPIEVQNPDGTTRTEKIEAYSSKDALKQAQKKFPGSGQWQVINSPENRTPSTEYSVPKGKLMSLRPDTASEKTPTEVMTHELGHAIIGQNEGLTQKGMQRHTHPDMPSSSRVGVGWDASDLFEPGTRRLKADKVAPVVRTFMGGIAADEAINGIPRAANHNFGDMEHPHGDAGQAYGLLKALGFTHEDAVNYLHKAIDDNVAHLSKPEISGIIKENAGVREPGLSSQYHYSDERLSQIHAEAQRRLANADRTNSEAGNRGSEENVAGGKGEGAPANAKAPEIATHEVKNPEDEDTSFKFGANVEPNEAAKSAQRFNAAKGQPEINHEAPPLNEGRAKALAAEMDTHTHEPNNPAVKKAYKSLIADVKEQWNHAQKDMGIKFEPSEKDPYDSYEAVKKDVEDNKRMKIFTGGNPLPKDHPLAKIDPETGLSYNTMLRGVHDLYGHIAGNNDFSEGGEAGATDAHKQMMSPESVPALLNETEGQVSQFFHGKDKGNFPPQNATIVPENFARDWHETAGKMAAKELAGGIDPKTGLSDTKGIGTELMTELRQPLDHAPTAEDFQKFYVQHKAIFDKYPELRVGWDNQSNVPGGHEINVGAVGPDAVRVAKKLDQAGPYDIGKGEVIPTGGTGLRTEFPNYPIEDRIKDLRGEPLSNTKGFEHLSQDFYDHLEPDERKYLEGNKTLQRNAMAQYHSITPSVNETTNAMQAGAALGGWWKRYMDVFQDLAGGAGAKPAGKELYHFTRGNFEQFDPMRGGPSGDFGTHFGTLDQAHGLMKGQEDSGVSIAGANVRPSYVNIKKPLRLTDTGAFDPETIVKQLEDMGILTDAQSNKLRSDDVSFQYDPVKVRNFLEKKGYDGIVYLNRVEGIPQKDIFDYQDRGDHPSDTEFLNRYPNAKATDSYVAFRPEQIKPKYSAELVANTIGPSHAEVLKQWHAAVSGNKSVQDANNLAWHSYADWLDAGKPTDRKSINDIVKKNAAQPEGSEKKGNAAISDTLDKKGKVLREGLDTSKLFALVNSPEMRGERPFSNDAFNEETPNALANKGEGARKLPSMGATVAGKGNLNRLVIDAHIRDFYGHKNSGGPAAQYIADSVHLRQAAEALGLKGGEGQEQLWGTVLGLKTLLKEGLTPEAAAGKLDAGVINSVGKDYAEVIANDPEIKPLLERLYKEHGVKPGKPAGAGKADQSASSAGTTAEGQPGGSQAPIDTASLAKTAGRIREAISPSKIKTPAAAEEVPAPYVKKEPAPVVEDKYTLALKAGDAAAAARREAMKKGTAGLSKPAK